MMRSILRCAALVIGATFGMAFVPSSARAQKALVYCPVTVDATGCNAIVNALTGPAYPLGVDRGYDGTGGTVDIKTVDLFAYSVFVVPSLADGSASQPYATLRDPEVAEHLKAALIGRIAMWSGSPDQGATNRGMKDALIQNLAGWAGGAFGTARGPGLVALLDASATAGARYDWLRAITPLPVASDPALLIYGSVRALNPRGTQILTSGMGPIVYDNMATFGFQVPNGAAGVSLDAVGQTGTTQGGQVVLVTMEGGNAGGATVRTDRLDYAPGETVIITGAGWQAGETVTLTLHEDPLVHEDRTLTAIADASGAFTNTEFAPEEHHLGVRFVLTAVGQTSGLRSQTTFTDSRIITSATLNGATSVTVSAGELITAVVNVTTDNAGGNQNWRSTGWRINTTVPGTVTCVDHVNHDGTGSYSESFSIAAPGAGTYNAYFIAYANDACSNQPSATLTLSSGVSVVGAPTLTSISPTSKVYGDAGFTLTVNGTNFTPTSVVTFNGSDRATSFASSTQLSATILASDLLNVGNFDVRVRNGAGVLTGVVQLAVNPRPITITADAKSKVYGFADPALTYQVTSGSLVSGDAFTGSLTRAAGENVGTYAITQGTVAINANYTITYVGANLSITPRPLTVTADAKSKVYGSVDPSLTFVVSGGPLVGSDAVSGTLARVAGEDVGVYAIQQGTVTAGANYSITYVGANLTITARPITVTADAATKTYGDADPAFTYQVTTGSLVSGDAFTGLLSRAAGENVGTHALQIGTLSAGTNYTITFVSANLTITARAITVTADPQTKVYGNTDPSLTYQVTTGALAFSDVFSGALTRDPGQDVGSYAINQGTLSAGTNYTLTFVGANLTITARPITVTADPKTKVYGDADPTLTYQVTLGSLAYSDAFTGALSRAAGENVGSYAITRGTLALTTNYNLSFTGANLTISARPITIAADPKSKTYGDPDPALTYQITAGNLVAPDVFSGTLARDAGNDVGTYAINQGSVTAGTNYAVTFVSANLTITQRAITVTADAQTKIYGEADPALTYDVTTGSLVAGDAFTGALARAPGQNVGTYAILQGTLSAGGNYALTYVGADLTITTRAVTVTADAKSKTYGDADPALTYQITSGTLAYSDAFSGTLARAAGENVGTYAIGQGTLALSANYVLTYVGANLTITLRPITVTADAQTKVYGNADPVLTYQLTAGSLVDNEDISGSLARAPGENIGGYAITQGSLVATSNYQLTFVGATLTITKRAITITADAKSKTYGNADPALTYQTTSGNLVGTDAFSGALTRVAGENVGTYAIQQGTVTAGGNYDLSFVGADLTITQRAITATATAQTKTYGDADPAFTYAITTGSLAFSDAFSGGLDRDAGEDVGSYAIKQGTLTAGGNYVLTFAGANLTITKRAVTITAGPQTKVYGEADPALTYSITAGSLAFTDAFAGALTRVAGEPVGTYAIQQGTVALSANYTLTYFGDNLSITPRAVTISADPKTKIYGESDPSLTYQITVGTLVGADAFTGALTRAAGENVGAYAINQGTVALGPNYALSYVSANLTITQRALTITADAKTKIYGDPDPALTYQLTTGTLVAGDAFTGSLTRASGETVASYAIQQGTVTAGANYLLSYLPANLTITQRALTVTANNKTKIAGAVNPPLDGVINGIQFSDNITANYTTTAVTGSLPGSYPITPTFVDPTSKLGNYTVTVSNGTLTVTLNAIPTLGAITAPLAPTALGTPITVSAPFYDTDVAASALYTTIVDWGNGTTDTDAAVALPGTISGTKTYGAPGVYTIKVTVTQNNFPSTHTATKTFEYYVVVYDPNAGFVTGGGWINSPAGAYAANPSLTGKATFGFVSKYKKGQTTPDGSTEFQFHAAGMNFKSTAYDWLVVGGAKAQFKGTGTIDGAGSYGFILTAIDGQISGGGGTDKFRIKIWELSNPTVYVYDNLLAAPDDAMPTTVLGGGSINIQAK